MTTSATTPTSILNTTPTTATAPANSLNTMTGGDFVKVMLAQLQHQDPLNPQDSGQLLTQMSDIASLQTNQSLSSTLTGLTLQQSVGAGSNMLGKNVQGQDASGAQLAGTVTSVTVQGQAVSLQLDSGAVLPIGNVTSITNPTAASTVATVAQSALGNGPAVPATVAPVTLGTDPAAANVALANLLAQVSGPVLPTATAASTTTATGVTATSGAGNAAAAN